jgi:two-component system chemotaxis sensor kinase CheA
MVIANANVNQQATRLNDKKLIESVSVVSRMLEEIREATMKTRLIPIGETFNRFKRIVRDLSKDLGKNIDLEIIGADTELDKTVTEKISDPLIHLVRNSLDHGIELPDDRIEKGKSSNGKITLKAFHEAGNIAIQIIDDGKGLDPDWLFEKAVSKGIISESDILTDKEKINLIMAAGFSTAEAITNVSGRGVGMDVVKRNIEELRGTIELDSKVGVGTTMTIRLPLTLAIIDGFMTKVGEQFYIIPLEMIVECLELNNSYLQEIKDNNYINLRGTILPLLDLRSFFNIPKGNTKRENIVVVTFGGNTIGLIVNELHGEFQTVIKPLGKIFRNVKGIGGSTILGSGQVAIILDVPMLMQSLSQHKTMLKGNN